MLDLTVVTPIKELQPLDAWLQEMKWLLGDTEWIVVDCLGRKELQPIATKYVKYKGDLWDSRRKGYSLATKQTIMNLDAFNTVPKEYVAEALKMIRAGKAVCCIDYEHSLGHYGFGTSIWNKKILDEIYFDPPIPVKIKMQTTPNVWHIYQGHPCECVTMWNRLRASGSEPTPLNYKAKNLGNTHGSQ